MLPLWVPQSQTQDNNKPSCREISQFMRHDWKKQQKPPYKTVKDGPSQPKKIYIFLLKSEDIKHSNFL